MRSYVLLVLYNPMQLRNYLWGDPVSEFLGGGPEKLL